MPSFRSGQVTEIISERRGLQRVRVGDERAYVLTQLTGPVDVGDRVVMNTTAVELGLGTGGWHVVHWNLARDEWAEPGPGHIMKLRYTSLQADTGAGEEQHPDVPTDLAGLPVVVGSLHSQVPGIAAAIREVAPDARISYVMTDGAALPLAFSDLVVRMEDAGLITGTVTAGHAFGGDLEAVTVASALALAKHVQRADIVIVAMGPGVVGTGTKLGTTAIEVAAIVDVAARIGGRAILCPRLSRGDGRGRHQGVSHHTTTALSLLHGPVLVPLPVIAPAAAADPELVAAVDAVTPAQAERSFDDGRGRAPHVVVTQVEVPAPDVAALLAAHGLTVTTMGRGPTEEPEFFAACGAAGVMAARLLGPGTAGDRS